MSHLAPEELEALATSKATPPAHLGSCPQCRAALTSARARRALLKGLKDLTLSETAFRRIGARLASESHTPVSGWALVLAQLRSRWLIASAVLALGLVAVAPRLLQRTPVVSPIAAAVVKPPAEPPRLVEAPPSVSWAVVLVEGSVWRNGKVLAAGEVVKAPDLVDARQGRVVLAALGRGLQLELLGLATFAEAALINLQEGTVALDALTGAVVEAGGAWVSGGDTAFVVSRAAAEVVVEVLRGSATVGADSRLHDSVTLTAPRRLRVPLPVKPPFVELDAEPAPYPFPVAPKQPWARLDLRDLPAGSRFDVAGQHGAGPSTLMLAEGRHRVLVLVPGQGTRETWVQLVSGSDTHLKLPPRGVTQHAEDAPPPTDEAIAELQRALKDQRPKLRACYEKWLKANPEATGEVLLTLVVSKNGKVIGARVDEATVPRESVDCLVRTGKRLVLPPLGAEQEIELPLSFTKGASRP